MPIELPPDFQRSISTTAQIVEKVLNEMEELLNGKKNDITEVVTENFSAKEKEQLLLKIAALRKCNEELFYEFNLKQTVQSEAQILQAQTAYLWTVLMDSKSKKLRGFGTLPPHLASILDEHIDKMLSLLQDISKRT